jgi:hypothetical protein
VFCAPFSSQPLYFLGLKRQRHKKKCPSYKAVLVRAPSNSQSWARTASPVYAATVRVHIKYAFGGMRRLDLEAGTNSDGKVRFAGLPARVQQPPLEFHGSKDEFEGVAAFDPSTECQGKHDITLAKSKLPDSH